MVGHETNDQVQVTTINIADEEFHAIKKKTQDTSRVVRY